MSGVGQTQTCRFETAMSALPPKADIPQSRLDVRFVPKAENNHLQSLRRREIAPQSNNRGYDCGAEKQPDQPKGAGPTKDT
jgi:hypothetical protein